MFTDEFLEEILLNPEFQMIPVGCQSTALHVFEMILEKHVKENPYESISAIFI